MSDLPSSPTQRDPIERGVPYCGDCGYDLSGCHHSPRCPECGGALVDVLMRPTLELKGGRRWRSRARIGSLPAIDIAFGPSGDERHGKPRGIIAIGDEARGVVAIGGTATGVVSFGGMSLGIFSFGGMSIGLGQAVGGMTIGGTALGGFAIGGLAQGGGAVGFMAQAGMAIGYYTSGPGTVGPHNAQRGDQAAIDAFQAMNWYFPGHGGTNFPTLLGSAFGIPLTLALLTLAIVAWKSLGGGASR